MLFLSPLALFGLVAALVPPLLHLFQRRRPPEMEFPAVRYLRQTEREAQRQVRLQHLLLMMLRVAAVVLIVLAAARPVVPGGGMALHEPTALAIILDNSVSSGTVSGGTPVLDALGERARETLRAAQAGDALWLIRADGIARRGTPAELLQLATAAADPRRLDLADAVRTAVGLVRASGYARKEVHVLSDLQETAIGRAATGSGQPAVEDVAILVYHPAAQPPANRGITAARPRPAVWLSTANAVGVIEAEIGGGPEDASAAPAALQLTLGGRSGTRTLARAGTAASLQAQRLGPGWYHGVVELEPDELRADDTRAVAVRVLPPAEVAAPSVAAAGSFVVQALSVLMDAGQARPWAMGNRQWAMGNGHALVIGDAPGRGPSIVFPPDDPARVGATNRALASAGVPWRFGLRVAREDTVVSAEVPEISGARVMQRLRLEPAGRADSSGVLARAGGDPWLVRHGMIVVAGSRMEPAQTSLPVSSAFVPFISALLNRLGRGESGVIEAAPGATITLPSRAEALSGGDTTLAVRSGAAVESPVQPGVYAVLSGGDTAALLVIAPDARESNLVRAGEGLVRSAFGAGTQITDDPGQYAARRFQGAGQSELTGWLLLGALIVLALEVLVASGRISGLADKRVQKAA